MSALLQKLRKASIQKALPLSLILMAAGILLFTVSRSYKVFDLLHPHKLSDLTPDTALGAYVSDDILYFYGEFMEEQRYRNGVPTGEIVSRYYIVDFDPAEHYMALKVHQADLDGAQTMMDASDAFYDAMLTGSEMPALPTVHVKGTIRSLDESDMKMLEEYSGGDENFLSACLPIYLDVGVVGTLEPGALLNGIVFSLLLFLPGLGYLLYFAFGGGQRQVRKKLSACSDLELTAQAASEFLAQTKPVHGVSVGKEYVIIQRKTRSYLYFPWDIAWAYGVTTKHSTNGIPTKQTYALELRLMDGTKLNVPMPNSDARSILIQMRTACPGIVLGYSKEKEAIYNTRRDVFSLLWEAARPGSTDSSVHMQAVPEMDVLKATPPELDLSGIDLTQTPAATAPSDEASHKVSLAKPTDADEEDGTEADTAAGEDADEAAEAAEADADPESHKVSLTKPSAPEEPVSPEADRPKVSLEKPSEPLD